MAVVGNNLVLAPKFEKLSKKMDAIGLQLAGFDVELKEMARDLERIS